MKSAAVFLALVATASAFNAPMMATRAVGKSAPAAQVCVVGCARHVPWTAEVKTVGCVMMELKR
jgi:hypothetical protein